jgi:hypothetical protein
VNYQILVMRESWLMNGVIAFQTPKRLNGYKEHYPHQHPAAKPASCANPATCFGGTAQITPTTAMEANSQTKLCGLIVLR